MKAKDPLRAFAKLKPSTSYPPLTWELTVVIAVQLISMPIAVLIAWCLGRTDVPGRRAFEFCFWIESGPIRGFPICGVAERERWQGECLANKQNDISLSIDVLCSDS